MLASIECCLSHSLNKNLAYHSSISSFLSNKIGAQKSIHVLVALACHIHRYHVSIAIHQSMLMLRYNRVTSHRIGGPSLIHRTSSRCSVALRSFTLKWPNEMKQKGPFQCVAASSSSSSSSVNGMLCTAPYQLHWLTKVSSFGKRVPFSDPFEKRPNVGAKDMCSV